MITSIAGAIVYVSDQDSALGFYRDTLGFEVVLDQEMGPQGRWLEVRPPGAQTSLMLADAPAFGRRPGEGAFLTFHTDDVAVTVDELRARGATTSDVIREPWGTYATVDAHDGHTLQFNERPRS